MMNEMRQKITLDQRLAYQIKVSGILIKNWIDWMDEMVITVEVEGDGPPVSTLTVTVDQAALQGLLRRLYYLGYLLISVNSIQSHENNIQ